MGKKVQIIINGQQRDESGEEDITETRATAEYYEKDNGFYLLYEETPENTALPARNMMKYRDSVLELTRRGAVNTRMVFEKQKKHVTDYITPYGGLKMEIFTRAMEVSCKNGQISLCMEYTLSSEGRTVSDCVLTVLILPLP